MTAERVRLTEAQRRALEWTWRNARWHGVECGCPSMAALMALKRKGLVTKRGGDGWPSYFYLTPAGRLALKEEPTNG